MQKTSKAFILVILLFSCNEVKRREAEFDAFINTIPPTRLPSTFRDYMQGVPSYKYDETFKRFKRSCTYRTLTRFSSKDAQFVILVDVDTGTMKVPFLVSYDKEGEKIDSLTFTQGPVYEDTFSIDKELIVNVDRFTVRRKIRSWEFDSITGVQQNEVTKTDSLVYNLSREGKFMLDF
jgi:hypothetical protein